MATKPIPEGYRTLTPQLAVEGAAAAIELYKKALGAQLIDSAPDPTGKKVWHASLKIGDSMIMVNDVFPDMGGRPSVSSLWVYVPDCDAAFKRAVDAGMTVKMPVADMFWGDRMGNLEDKWGINWTIATRIKDMTPEEQQKAAEAFVKQMKK
jgi:uncharacterized glyoxalase superfamily protein PhnB